MFYYYLACGGIENSRPLKILISTFLDKRNIFLSGEPFQRTLEKIILKMTTGNSLAVQWLQHGTFNAKGLGSIPVWGTKIPQTALAWPNNNNNNKFWAHNLSRVGVSCVTNQAPLVLQCMFLVLLERNGEMPFAILSVLLFNTYIKNEDLIQCNWFLGKWFEHNADSEFVCNFVCENPRWI